MLRSIRRSTFPSLAARSSSAARGTCAALALSALAACSNESSGSASATLAPPNLTVVSLRPAGRPVWRPGSTDCVARGADPDGTVAVLLGVDKDSAGLSTWTFASPSVDSCNGAPQCGYAVLTVCGAPTPDSPAPASCAGNPTAREFIAAGPTVSIPVARLADPRGPHHLHVELVNGDGTAPATGSAAAAFATDLDVVFCAGASPGDAGVVPGDAAADAAMDATTDAVAPDASPDAASEAGIPEGGEPDASVDGAPDATPTDASTRG